LPMNTIQDTESHCIKKLEKKTQETRRGGGGGVSSKRGKKMGRRKEVLVCKKGAFGMSSVFCSLLVLDGCLRLFHFTFCRGNVPTN